MKTKELVINFHMTEICNFRCNYCYATWQDNPPKPELHHSQSKVSSLLVMLASYFLNDNPLKQQMGYTSVRLNFAGGEPVMLGSRFVDAILEAKSLGFATSIITNGHLLTDCMLGRIAPYLDKLGISFDTADHLIANSIGRIDRKNSWLRLERLVQLCADYRAMNTNGLVKINTVVNAMNWREDLNHMVDSVQPDTWKILRVLPVYNDNLAVLPKQYKSYLNRHVKHAHLISPEDNEDMWGSYLMINPRGCFYQNTSACNGLAQSEPIIDVGVAKALSGIDFNSRAFAKRYASHLPINNFAA